MVLEQSKGITNTKTCWIGNFAFKIMKYLW
jgi:hypothetical protein